MFRKHMQRCLLSLTIKEMQIKTKLIFYLIPVRIGTTRTPLTTNVDEDVGRKEPTVLVEM
jgi:hypothetical protein